MLRRAGELDEDGRSEAEGAGCSQGAAEKSVNNNNNTCQASFSYLLVVLFFAALARQAEAYKLSAQRPASAASAKQHESRLVDLDTQKYGLAKTIADLEQATSSAEASLAKCREHAGQLEKIDPAGDLQSSGNVADA